MLISSFKTHEKVSEHQAEQGQDQDLGINMILSFVKVSFSIHSRDAPHQKNALTTKLIDTQCQGNE